MGQKVNPVGFRLGVNRGWDSVWYAKKKDFGNYLIEDFKIREYIKKNVINSGVSKVMIERTSNKCYVTIYTSRPGFVIGKKGRVWTRIFPNIPVSKKPIEVRMGKGKGSPEYFACRVKPGRILFEVDGVSEQIAKEALYKASAKLPIKTKTIKRFA